MFMNISGDARISYWDREIETMSREGLENLQSQRLRETVRRVYERVPFYRQAFKDKGIEPGDIKSLADLSKLPFTVKQDLRDNYPYGLFAAPMSDIVRIHASSGTTGKPSVVGYTRQDIENWAEMVARALVMAGGTKHDVVHVAYGYGLFTGGLGLHYGVERLGASVVPVSGGNTDRQLMLLQDFGATMIACTPSYALYLAEEGQAAGIDFKKHPLRIGIFGARRTETCGPAGGEAFHYSPGHLRAQRGYGSRGFHGMSGKCGSHILKTILLLKSSILIR